MPEATRRLLYFADPMCSWCWGFTDALKRAEAHLVDGLRIQYVLCGLAPDDDAPMDADTRNYVQSAWHAVAARSGARFNHSFWTRCSPRRSTWPACRAVLAAERMKAGLGRTMFGAIQAAYYLAARDPSDRQVLVQLAQEHGLDPTEFSSLVDDPAIRLRLAEDFALRDALGVRGYPSLVLQDGESREVLSEGWIDTDSLEAELRRRGVWVDVQEDTSQSSAAT